MSAIANCESRKDPTATHLNKNGSRDYGIFQIKDIHEREMKDLGLDIRNNKDNIKYAMMIAEKNGLSPWSASKQCWGKLGDNL